uniref:N6-adenosine-specific RNA methylase IME4 n=2 Tax=Candidatus Kentrum sp. SD TaxID=2126332 RepID=A0A450Z5W8_9GAMM|nr:MAG: N6-adenosine-specific RNA methylase IME4 [Candidatus Kentron sp. SD]
MTDLKIKQEFKDLIPPLSKEEFEGLEKNILTNGCEESIKLWHGYIVDGHNRYNICTKHNIPFKPEELKKETEQDVLLWIIDHQLDRRNISIYSRGKLILRKKNELSKGQGHRSDLENVEPPLNWGEVNSDRRERETDRKLSKESGIGHNTLSRIAKIEERATPEQKKALEENRVSVNDIFTKIQKEEKRANRDATLQATEFPKGKYRVIYADPPWEYYTRQEAEKHYHTMPLDELCAMPVKDISDENAVLFLWVTAPLLPSSLRLIEAWGFEHKTQFIWDKVKHNMGYYSSVRHELLLVCTKGSCTPDNVELIDSVQSIERTRHSEKPEEFRKIIETLYKYGNKIELFARKKTEGWDVYGNEITEE